MKSRPRPFRSLAVRLLLLLALVTTVTAQTGPVAAQEVDTTPPDTFLDSVPPDVTDSTEATFGFSSDDPAATFLCSIDGSDWEPCASPMTYTALAVGATHQFAVIAVDAAGNADQSPASDDWTVQPPPDTEVPQTTISSGPDNPTESTEATFDFSSDDPAATFLCSIDGSDWEACASPKTYTDLAVAPHRFGVIAVDAAGNADESPELYDWTIAPPPDTEAPETTITSGPENPTDSTTAKFEFESDDPDARFECTLPERVNDTPCTSGVNFADLHEGDWTFMVRAFDAVGNEGPWAQYSWTVAWEPQVETFEGGDLAFWTDIQGDGLYLQSDLVASGDSAVRGTSTGQATVLTKTLPLPQQEVFYRTKFNLVDRGDNPVTLLQLYSVSGAPLATLFVSDDGRLAYRNEVQGATRTSSVVVTEDTWHEVEVRLVADQSGTIEVWYDGNHLDDLSRSEALGFEAVSHISLGDGATNRSYDVAFDEVSVDTSFITADIQAPLDTTAPETTIEAGSETTTADPTAIVIFSADETDVTFECALDGAAFEGCASPAELSDLEPGEHELQVRAIDQAGNTDVTPAIVTLEVDLTAPTVSNVLPADGATDVPVNDLVEVTFSEAMDPTTLTAATVTLVADGATEPVAAVVDYDPSTLQALVDPDTDLAPATTYTATVTTGVADVAGNALAADYAWSFTTAAPPDATAPETTIETGPASTTRQTTAAFTFSSEDGATFACALDGGAFESCTSPVNLTDLADGQHTFAVRATDAAGNTDATPATRTWTVDTAAPDTTLSATPASVTNSTTGTFTFASADSTATFACRIDGGSFTPCTSPAEYTGLTAGVHTFQVQAIDGAGNTDATPATYSWTVDTTAPDTAVNGPSGTINARTATLDFSSEVGATFECSLDSQAFAVCTSPVNLTDLADGQHTFAVRAIDGAGNRDASPAMRTWTVDATAPTVSASPAGGTYSAPQTVTLTASEPATIRYTTDGSTPTTSSPIYTAPISISQTTTLKAVAVDSAGNTSAATTDTYTISSSTPTTGTFSADADAMVDGSTAPKAGTNYGTTTVLQVDTDPAQEAFLKFTVSGVSGPVTSAKVRLYMTNGTGNGPDIYLVDNTWTETGLTWNNRPARISAAADDLGALNTVNTWVEFNVTSLVTGNGTYSFNLGRQSTDGVFFNSKQVADASLRPQLVVTSGGADVLPPTVSASPRGGAYNAPQTVTLTASEPATIRYTTDGSNPTATSPVYSSPIAIDQTTTLKFFAVDAAGNASAVVTEPYTINVGATTLTLAPVADAKVDNSTATTAAKNYGTTTDLVSDGSPAIESFLMFTVNGLSGPVQNAKLRLYVSNDTGNGPEIFKTGTTWTETGLTWNNRPGRVGTALDDKGALPINAWVEYNVTSAITGNGTYAFTLVSTSSDAVTFWAKEYAANTELRPQLVVTAQNGALPVVNASPAGGTYTSAQNVTLTATYTEPTTIHYTTDGSTPTTASPVYSSPLSISQTTTLKFFAISGSSVSSAVKTETYTINGDFVPPETTITPPGPANPSNQATASIAFTSNETGSTFQCSLDGAAYAACTSPRQLTGLTEGSHTFRVRAVDAALNTDATPAEVTWTVDLTAPTVTTTTPADLARDVDPALAITATFAEAMNAGTLTTSTFTLVKQGTTTPVSATVTYDLATKVVTLDPAATLDGDASYTARLLGGASGIKDLAGNPLATDRVWSFTTRGITSDETITLAPAADATTNSGSPATNFGNDLLLGADTDTNSAVTGNQVEQSYLKFDVTGITGTPSSARLRLYVHASTANGPKVYATGTGWTETGITWNTKPATIGGADDDVGAINSGTWVEYNVSAVITGDGTYSFALVPDTSDGSDFNARENTSNRPELVISYGGTPVTVSASPAGGMYDGPQSVTLTASEPATIHYTTDGNTPTTASPVYSTPIAIAASTTLKFFAITPDNRSSEVMQQAYTIQVTGFRDFTYGTSAGAPTAKESQSKLWYTDGTWWGVLFSPTARTYNIFELDTATQIWTDTGVPVDARDLGKSAYGKIDVLWDGSKLYVVTHKFATSGDVKPKVIRFSYAGGTYTPDYPAVPISGANTGPEVVTIAKDTTGTLWLTWTESNTVVVTHTAGNEQTWVTPYELPVTGTKVSTDDISAIVSFGGKIGVMWSNQTYLNPHSQSPDLMDKMYFAYHVDGAPDTAWTGEVAYDLAGNAEAADDHINIKADSSGRLYVAAKTSLNATSDPLINLLVRSTGGTWSSHVFSTAQYALSRPIVQLDEAAGRVYIFASRYDAGSVVYYKSASMSNPVFPSGLGTPIIASESDPKIKDVTSTKQNVSAATGLVILAGDDSTRTYLHNFLPLS